MTRTLTVAAAQLGLIARDEPRSSAVARMGALMEESKRRGADLARGSTHLHHNRNRHNNFALSGRGYTATGRGL